MLEKLVEMLNVLPKQLIVFIVSILPLIELRGGIIAAYAMGLPLYEALFLSILGNMLPVPFILLFIKNIFKFMRDHGILTNLINKVTDKAMSRSDKVSNLEFWGLVIFVGIPLPGTGAWTGALIAALLNIEFKKAMLALFLGVIMAATIMSLGTYGIIHIMF